MKRAFKLLLALGGIALAIWLLLRVLASDEARIRWLLEDARDGFNTTDLSAVLGALAHDFEETESGADKELAKHALIAVFFEEKDAATKRFALVAQADFEQWIIEVADDATARASGECALYRTQGDERRLLWRFATEAELRDDDEHGWQISRARCTTLEGRRRVR